MLARVPKVFGVGEARKAMTEILEEVSKGHTFIIKGTKNREALVIDADRFRGMQDAYMDLVGLVETRKILEDDATMEVLREVSADDRGATFSLLEVERMVRGDGDIGGDKP